MRKKLAAFILIIMISLPAYCIGFGYHVFKVRTDPSFSIGNWELPISTLYQFNFPVPDLVKGSATSFSFRLDNGLEYRKLRQDPETGAPINPLNHPYPIDYMVLYDEFNFALSQGLVHMDFNDEDLITLNVLVGGRFESAFENFDYYSDASHKEGVFHTIGKNEEGESVIADREPFGSSFLPGTPELSGDRTMFEINLSAGIDINLMKDEITSRNGMRLSSWIRVSPSWLNFFSDRSDYLLWWTRLDLAWTLFSIPLSDELSALSMMLSNSTEYRFISGNKVPSYIQGGEIWQAEALSSEHVITNRTELTLFGPQLFAPDVYPYASAFICMAYSFGNVLNSDSLKLDGNLAASYGVRAEVVLFNVARVYYEIGAVSYSDGWGKSNLIQRFGFALGV